MGMSIMDILSFIKAGRAEATLVNHSSGNRYTLRFRRPEQGGDDRPIWVHVLAGPDNEHDYKFLGTIWNNREQGMYLHQGGKSYWPKDDTVAQVVQWLLYKLNLRQELPESVEFMHSGTCGRCGRKLTTPESIQTGLGPVCAERQ